MLRKLKFIPIILYPYAYIPILIFYSEFIAKKYDSSESLLYTIILCNALFLFCSIYCAVKALSINNTNKSVVKTNLVIKLLHVPAYLIHFILGLLGLCMSIWGIGLIVWAVIIDILSILISGIYSIGCCIRVYRDRLISLPICLLCIIGSFTFCLDIVVAFILNKIVKRSYECY